MLIEYFGTIASNTLFYEFSGRYGHTYKDKLVYNVPSEDLSASTPHLPTKHNTTQCENNTKALTSLL